MIYPWLVQRTAAEAAPLLIRNLVSIKSFSQKKLQSNTLIHYVQYICVYMCVCSTDSAITKNGQVRRSIYGDPGTPDINGVKQSPY